MHWWNGWLHRHPGDFLTVSGVLITGIATLVLAIVTLRLANDNKRLAEITGMQGENNFAHNERSYRLTQLQINLQYRASYYEQLIAFTQASLNYLRETAKGLGIDCEGLHENGPTPIGTPADQGLLGIQLRLHASDEIRLAFLELGTKVKTETDKLTSLQQYGMYGVMPLVNPLLDETTVDFRARFILLTNETEALIESMIDELHPSTRLSTNEA